MNTMQICNQEIQVNEYNGQRVVTFRDIDLVHGREKETAKRNFNSNREHFIDGVDFFPISRKEFSTKFVLNEKLIGNPNVSMLFITESGYLMLCKSFTDSLAWRVQRELVNCYFKIQQIKELVQESTSEELTVEIKTTTLSQKERLKIGDVIASCPQYNMAALVDVYREYLSPSVIDFYMNAITVTANEKSISVQIPSNISTLIIKGLQNKNMMQKDLAEQLGCAKSTISHYVHGKTKPQRQQLQRIVEILNIVY